jgi:hypothetical protein
VPKILGVGLVFTTEVSLILRNDLYNEVETCDDTWTYE